MREVNGGLKKTKNQIDGTAKSLRGLTGIAIAGISFAGLATIVKNTAEWGDELSKLAQQTGTTTGFLQELDYAYKRNGLSSADATNNVETFAKRLARLKGNYGVLAEELRKDSGLTKFSNELKSMNTQDGFEHVLKQIRESNDEAEKLRIAVAAFGDGAQRVILVADQFENAKNRAHELGIIMDADMFSQFEEANDQLLDMNVLFSAQTKIIVAKLMPGILGFSKGLLETIEVFKTFKAEFFSKDFEEQNIFELSVTKKQLHVDVEEMVQEIEKLHEKIAAEPVGNGILGIVSQQKNAKTQAEIGELTQKLFVLRTDISTVNELIAAKPKDVPKPPSPIAPSQNISKAELDRLKKEKQKIVDEFNRLLDPADFEKQQRLAKLAKIKDEISTEEYQKIFEKIQSDYDDALPAAKEAAESKRKVELLIQSLLTPDEIRSQEMAEFNSIRADLTVDQQTRRLSQINEKYQRLIDAEGAEGKQLKEKLEGLRRQYDPELQYQSDKEQIDKLVEEGLDNKTADKMRADVEGKWRDYRVNQLKENNIFVDNISKSFDRMGQSFTDMLFDANMDFSDFLESMVIALAQSLISDLLSAAFSNLGTALFSGFSTKSSPVTPTATATKQKVASDFGSRSASITPSAPATKQMKGRSAPQVNITNNSSTPIKKSNVSQLGGLNARDMVVNVVLEDISNRGEIYNAVNA